MSFPNYEKLFEMRGGEKSPLARDFPTPTGARTVENMDRYNQMCLDWMNDITKEDPKPQNIKISKMYYRRGDYQGYMLVYRPDTDEKNLPIMFFTHGGSFLFWVPEYYNNMCGNIAERSNCVVVNIDFRENFGDFYIPDMYADIQAAVETALDQADAFGGNPEKFGVMGDSSGGMIAAGLPMFCEDHGFNKKFSLKILLEAGCGFDINEISNNNAYASKTELMGTENVVKRGFAKFEECSERYWSPILDEYPEKWCTTVLCAGTASYMLTDSCKYAKKLMDAGVKVEFGLFQGMVHGFYNGGCGPTAVECWDFIADNIKKYLG